MNPGGRDLIVNADDFGRSPGINRGVVAAHERGIVTSASLMTRWPSAIEAGAYARSTSALSVGIHLDLAEWIYRAGVWEPVYEVVPEPDVERVRNELLRQLTVFERLTGRLPTHVDSHQHVHRTEPVRSLVLDLATDLGVPVREESAVVAYCPDFYGQTGDGQPLAGATSVPALIAILASLPIGISELSCHPGSGDESNSVYSRERDAELETLCDVRVRSALDDHAIALRSFHDIKGL